MNSLKPGPFCGGKAKLKRGLPSIENSKEPWALVQCLKCFCRTQTIRPNIGECAADITRRAVAIWNRRADDGN